MLFGTYQEMFDTMNMPKNCLNPNRYYNKKLGFSPLWAFPVEDLAGFATHSICTAPNFADIFYLIETDDYVRVNKVKHYQMIAEGKYKEKREEIDLSPVIDDEADNDHSEFLLNPDTIGIANIKCMCFIGNAKENAYDQLKFIAPPIIADDRVMWEIARVIEHFAKKIPEFDFEEMEHRLLQSGYSAEYAKVEGKQRILKYIFELVVLPYVYEIYVRRNTNLTGYKLGALAYNAYKILTAENDFALWSYGDCRLEDYDRLFNKIKSLIITDDKLLKNMAESRKIYPNDPCPCGSGKKYKKCHGR